MLLLKVFGALMGALWILPDGTYCRKPPHIISIISDDMGFNDIGYNNDEVLTPRMDELAKDGLILTNNYVQPVCTPSRASFMTGRYPFTIGMQHGILGPATPLCAPTDVPFLSNYLKDGGYQTHMSGKWHLGACRCECTPTERGFDTFLGLLEGMGDFYTHRFMGGFDWRNGREDDNSTTGRYVTDLITERAVETIGNYDEGDKPIFMWLTYTSPHTPLQAPDSFKELYPDVEEPRKTYLGMVSSLDAAVGEVVDKLKDKGLWDNTFFMYSSDNGGEGHGSSNLPLRGGKGSLFEGGTRVPGFVAGPLLANPGTTTDSLMHISDWAPTFLTIAGIDYDADAFTGMDQSKMFLEGAEDIRTEFIYNIDIEWTGGFFLGNAAIRQGEMKMIWGMPGLVDRYGDDMVKFQHNKDYLSLIDKTNDDYTDIPPKRPFPYWMSPQEKANQQAIAKKIGIDHITEEEVEKGRGQVLLFNVKEDPEEKENLAENDKYKDLIADLKAKIMGRIKEDYLSPIDEVAESRRAAASPRMHPPLMAWTPGWCEDVDMNFAVKRNNDAKAEKKSDNDI